MLNLWPAFPGYPGPGFYNHRHLLPAVAPVVPPIHPAFAGQAAMPASPFPQPAPGSPLAVLAHTSLGPGLADLIARAPQVADRLVGHPAGAFPPEIPGMPRMPSPPTEMFNGPGSGLGRPVAPVEVPHWLVEQMARQQQAAALTQTLQTDHSAPPPPSAWAAPTPSAAE